MGENIIRSKIIFAALILFVLVSLTCVSAAENQTADDAVLESDTVTEEILMDEPAVANFTTLKNDIANAGNELKLERDYAFNNDEDQKVGNGGVKVEKDNFVIDGQGHTLNGSGKVRMLMIFAENVTIKNINFINGYINGDAGAILWSVENGLIQNCNFTDNRAWNSAGAISSNKKITVENCNFNNNTADYYGAGFFYDVNIINCSFTNNVGGKRGGAFYCYNSNITNCIFINNRQEEEEYYEVYGGALAITSSTVSNCNFTNNSAIDGGAIWSQGNSTINNCNFINNSANNGGAIFYRGGSSGEVLTVNNCNFANNNATNGGGIYAGNIAVINNCNLINNTANVGGGIYFNLYSEVNGGNFINNNATNGGAIYFKENGAVTDCNFNNNAAMASYGGAIYFNKYGCVTGSHFNNNFAQVSGGAIFFHENGTVIKSTLTNNTAEGVGGAVYLLNGGIIDSCDFSNNFGFYGGAIYNNGKTTVKDSVFANNTAVNYGGAIYFNAPEGVVENSNFTYNHLHKTDNSKGGAIYFEKDGVVKCCELTDNNAEVGGAVYFNGNGTAENSCFDNNTAKYGGGAVYSDGDALIVEKCVFNNNKIVSDTVHNMFGGAIQTYQNALIINSNFTNNYAWQKGGAISTSGMNITIENCNFESNNVNGNGGAIYLANNGTVSHSNFINNNGNGGGAIFCEFNGIMKDCNFINNGAANGGGAIEFNSQTNGRYTEGIVERCNFTNNHINGIAGLTQGGAIHFGGSFGSLKNSNFFNNSASGPDDVRGGAVQFDCECLVENCNFTSNRVLNGIDANGGAIYFREKGTVKSNAFNNNSAVKMGGAIYFEKQNSLEGNNFHSNNAKRGGAVYFQENGTVINNTFDYNNAGEYGGSLFFYKNGTVMASKFNNNHAGYNGGAIHFNNNGVVSHSNFSTNTANQIAGAIYAYDSTKIESSNFEQNTAIFYGGAVYFYKYGELLDDNFTNNHANAGGAINFQSNGRINGGNINANTANSGGAVNAYGNLTVGPSNFEDNVATDGTNHIALNGDATISIFSYQDLSPFKAAKIYLMNVPDAIYGDIVNITVKVTCEGKPLADGIVFATLNNVNYTGNVENGTATINIPNLDVGLYNIGVTYVGDSFYTKPTMDVEFSVREKIISLEVANISNISYGDSLNITVKLGESLNSGQVYVIINDEVYSANVTDGIGTVSISKLDAGNYDGFAVFVEENHIAPMQNIKFTVEKKNAAISANDAVYIINYGGKYSAAVVGAVGETVAFFLNGKNIGEATVNANGIATISLSANILKAEKAGSKNLVIKLTNGNYNCNEKAVKITINKEAAKITAKKITFKKAKKVKKYAITLKDSKGKAIAKAKVTLKIKGKTYKATTNAKGKATFKIKNLKKKGTFKATITYKGNAYYNKANKKVKIRVK